MKMKKLKGYNLYYKYSNKYKNTLIKFVFRDKITKENNVYTTLLFMILLYSSKNYDTKRKIDLKKQDLYNLNINCYQDRFKSDLINYLDLDLINPSLTEESLLHDSILFLKELLFNPFVIDNHFDKEIFNIIKTKLRNDVMSIKESKQDYCNVKLLEVSKLNYPLDIDMYLDIDLLDNIDEYILYDFYKQYFNNNKLDIFVISNVKENIIINELNNLGFSDNDKKLIDNKVIFNKQEVIYGKENITEPQSKLSRLYKIDELNEFEYKYVSNIYAYILGGISNSLLMKNVREKLSLCYYIDANLQKTDNIMIINTGFDKNNYNKLIENIDKNLELIKNGNFDKNLINDAIEMIVNVLKNSDTKIYSVLSFEILINLYNIDKVKDRIINYKKVNYEDIVNFAKKVSLYSEYYLVGDSNE